MHLNSVRIDLDIASGIPVRKAEGSLFQDGKQLYAFHHTSQKRVQDILLNPFFSAIELPAQLYFLFLVDPEMGF